MRSTLFTALLLAISSVTCLLAVPDMPSLQAEKASVLLTSDRDAKNSSPLVPKRITELVAHDSDDPAIWINPHDPLGSLILGTDKHTDGALYVFDLEGKIREVVRGLKRPNNVDVAYALSLGEQRVDIAVVTEREMQRLRVYRLPEMTPLDNGDLVVFGGDRSRAPMGVACYKRPSDGAVFVLVGGKAGPADGYLWQYRLEGDSNGRVKMTHVRSFGQYSGKKEIEAIAVDAALGYVYYSDETHGVRKYHADPDHPRAAEELALFGTEGFASDHEGISIYATGADTGYILVSNQQAHTFRVFPREGEPGRPHSHPLLTSARVAAQESDGSEITDVPLGSLFPRGLLVAMSTDRTFHFYSWDELSAAAGLDRLGVNRGASGE